MTHRPSARPLAAAVLAAALAACTFGDPIPDHFSRLGYSQADGAIRLHVQQCGAEPVTVRAFAVAGGEDGVPGGEPLVEAESTVDRPGVVTLTLGEGQEEDDFETRPGSVVPPPEDLFVEVRSPSSDGVDAYSISRGDIPPAPRIGRRSTLPDVTAAEFEAEAAEAC